MTIAELAAKVGVTGATICRYENGDRKMTVEMAKKIAHVLNVKCWWKLYD
jgi:transcriptional regulator with XRE-family HTH domain